MDNVLHEVKKLDYVSVRTTFLGTMIIILQFSEAFNYSRDLCIC